ncbi:MAG: hypothetical protein GC159_01270 [Phycisphaera sp.]|nr:hypothetical protein [Phycisphaera sp.]
MRPNTKESSPPDLQTLADSQPLDLTIFRNPKNSTPVGPPDRVNEWTDYAYLSGLDVDAPVDLIVLFVIPEQHQDGFGLWIRMYGSVTGGPIAPELDRLAATLREHPEWKLIIPPSMTIPEPLKDIVDRE